MSRSTQRRLMIETLNLQSGSFKMVLPYKWQGWLGYVIFGFVTLFGIAATISGLTKLPEDLTSGLFCTAIGLLFLALCTPGSHEKDLHDIRQQAIDPAELEAKAKESGLTVDNWFLRQTTYVPTNDPNDWILPAPGPATWNTTDRYAEDSGGQPIPEHPVRVGTPIPATLSLYGIFGLSAVLFFILGVGSVIQEVNDKDSRLLAIGGVSLVAVIWLIFGWLRAKMLNQMIDTPTSLVRSVALGHRELVGQARPSHEGVLRVVVDGNERMFMENMVAYNWTYEQHQERTVRTKEGTRTERRWVTIRSDDGGCPFILHDGTGGIRVNGQSFKRSNYGNYIKRWDSAFAESLGKQFMASLVAGVLGGWRVIDHRWTLYGIKLGNPVYIMGEVKSRPRADIDAENLDGTRQNSIIEVWGNSDGVGQKVTINRGTELSNIGRSRSSVEMIALPMLLFLGALCLLALA